MVTQTSDERDPANPALNPGDSTYFEALGSGRLLLKRCRDCGEAHHYPRAICPHCWSAAVDWIEADGKGEIYTFSVTRRGAGAPYCIAYVTLDEGPTMMTNIVDIELDEIRIGQRVELAIRHSSDGTPIPMFRPEAARQEAE